MTTECRFYDITTNIFIKLLFFHAYQECNSSEVKSYLQFSGLWSHRSSCLRLPWKIFGTLCGPFYREKKRINNKQSISPLLPAISLLWSRAENEFTDRRLTVNRNSTGVKDVWLVTNNEHWRQTKLQAAGIHSNDCDDQVNYWKVNDGYDKWPSCWP